VESNPENETLQFQLAKSLRLAKDCNITYRWKSLVDKHPTVGTLAGRLEEQSNRGSRKDARDCWIELVLKYPDNESLFCKPEKAFEREAEFPLVLKNCKALLDSQPHNQNLRQRLYSFVDHQVLQSFS